VYVSADGSWMAGIVAEKREGNVIRLVILDN
jgi:hypothetical protein